MTRLGGDLRRALTLLRGPTVGLMLTSGVPGMLRAQSIDTSLVYFTPQPVPLVIHLDSIGLYAPAGLTMGMLDTVRSAPGIVSMRDLGQGLFVVGLAAPLPRNELVALARTFRGSIPGSLVGLVTRRVGSPRPIFITDHFVVEFQENVTAEQIDSLNAVHGVAIVTRLGLLQNDYLLSASPRSTQDALDLANIYHEHALTVFAHPNSVQLNVPSGFIPNDVLFPDQWHLDNTGQHGSAMDADIDAPEAWDITSGSQSVVIAIVEAFGFDTLNPDIAANLWANPGGAADSWAKSGDVRGWNFLGCHHPVADAHTEPCGSSDLVNAVDSRHGNAVAGLAAARGNNTVGVSGVCPTCSIMLVTPVPTDVGTATAIRYTQELGADVINLSFTRGQATYTTEQVEVAAGAGVPVVISAGHDEDGGLDDCGTMMYGTPLAIAVGGSDDFDTRVGMSNFGSCLTVMAPGWMANTAPQVTTSDGVTRLPHVAGLVTADSIGTGGYNNRKPLTSGCKLSELPTALDYTECFSGTSGAAPIVSGVIGLMKTLNPGLSVSAITDILRRTADKIDAAAAAYDAVTGQSLTHGWGRVNAFCALRWIQGSTNCAPLPLVDIEPAAQGEFEVGVRAGLTYVNDGTASQTTTNLPGGGPRARPVVYADVFPSPSWMLELQLGFSRTIYSGATPDVTQLGAALQTAYRIGGLYLGPNVAVDYNHITGSGAVTYGGYGGALGYRFMPTTFVAFRVEALARNWPALSQHELSLAVGAGVVF